MVTNSGWNYSVNSTIALALAPALSSQEVTNWPTAKSKLTAYVKSSSSLTLDELVSAQNGPSLLFLAAIHDQALLRDVLYKRMQSRIDLDTLLTHLTTAQPVPNSQKHKSIMTLLSETFWPTDCITTRILIPHYRNNNYPAEQFFSKLASCPSFEENGKMQTALWPLLHTCNSNVLQITATYLLQAPRFLPCLLEAGNGFNQCIQSPLDHLLECGCKDIGSISTHICSHVSITDLPLLLQCKIAVEKILPPAIDRWEKTP